MKGKIMHRQGKNRWLVVALIFLILGGVGFGLLAYLPARTQSLPEEPQPKIITLEENKADKLSQVNEFWREQGFIVQEQTLVQSNQEQEIEGQLVRYKRWQHRFHIIPSQPDLDFAGSVAEFEQKYTADGQLWETTDKEVKVSFWQQVPAVEEQVITVSYEIRLQTPKSFAYPSALEGADTFAGGAGAASSRPQIAVVIDDWGYSSRAAEPLLQYPFPLTVAVLPFLPRSQELAEEAVRLGHEVILHLPMEPINPGLDPGPGGILTDMDKQEVREQLEENLAHLPMIVGANNHMGSKATSDRELMQAVLQSFQEHNLFFLDSYTAPTSVVKETAEQVGLPYAVNDIFLDNVNEEEAIIQQFRQAINLAKKRGRAIVIGHVRPRTADALWQLVPEIIYSGVELVPVSHLLTVPQATEVDDQSMEEYVKPI